MYTIPCMDIIVSGNKRIRDQLIHINSYIAVLFNIFKHLNNIINFFHFIYVHFRLKII